MPRYGLLKKQTEEAVLTMKIEEKTRRNKNYLRETLVAPPRRKASLVVEVDEIDAYKTALQTALESKAGRKGALPANAGAGEPAALPAAASAEKGAPSSPLFWGGSDSCAIWGLCLCLTIAP